MLFRSAGQGRGPATRERLLAIRAIRLKDASDEASDLVAAAARTVDTAAAEAGRAGIRRHPVRRGPAGDGPA